MALDGDYGDVVGLSELLGCVCNLGRGLCGQGFGTFEAEEFAFLVLGFDYTVGVEGESAAKGQVEAGRFVIGDGHNAEGERAGEFHFSAVEVGGEVSGICDGDPAIGGDVGCEGGGKSAMAAADEAVVQLS
jgi:hypothetical protein